MSVGTEDVPRSEEILALTLLVLKRSWKTIGSHLHFFFGCVCVCVCVHERTIVHESVFCIHSQIGHKIFLDFKFTEA